ncbi:hypothetical protein [Amycolatopsis sp. NPDC051372]|uniref:hypothetical protein n=1 Tax=unclassified Amycolatopsis TaxID=2618356 RepID=UPI003440323D
MKLWMLLGGPLGTALLTGAALLGIRGHSPLAAAGIGFPSALTSGCLLGGATTTVLRKGITERTVIPTFTDAVPGFGAAAIGVALVS